MIFRKEADYSEQTAIYFFHTGQVRFYDVDMTWTAFFTNHLKWFDDVAFPEFSKKAGMDWSQFIEQNIDMSIVHLSFDYKSPLFLDDSVLVCLTGLKLGQTSMTIYGSLYRGQTLIGEGQIAYAFVDFTTRQSIPVPDLVREKVGAIVN